MRRNASILLTVLLASLSIYVYNGALADVRASPDLPSDMPVLFVDPVDIIVAPGENLTISVKIFNLTDSYYATNQTWNPGESLGPPGSLYNYSLGNLYGLEIMVRWDPTILNYTQHTVTIPVETYPDGVLHQTTFVVKNEVIATNGTYEISATSMSPAPPFNCPSSNSTVFNMTFNAIGLGTCTLNITLSSLAEKPTGDYPIGIPHWVIRSDITVIPEFPSVVILPLFIIATLIVALVHRKRHLIKTV